MANITWKLNVSFNAATTAPPSLALINSGVIRGFIGLVTKGLTQYQLKFPGPFSTDFNNSVSTSYNSSHIPTTCRTWRQCIRNQQQRDSWKITFWAWEGQSVPKEHTRKHEKKNVGPDQNGSEVVPACQKLNKSKADPQNIKGQRPAIQHRHSLRHLRDKTDGHKVSGAFSKQ